MDMSKYRGMFLSETQEHLRSMTRLVVALEKNPADREGIDSLFRAAHSIKGMAASMGYGKTAELAHHLEDLMDGFRKGGALSTVAIDRLLAGIDLLAGLLEDVASGEPEREVRAFLASAAIVSSPEPPRLPRPPRRDERGRTVRVRTELLDRFINLTGELITNRYALQAAFREGRWPDAGETLGQLRRLINDLHHHVLQVRMMPLESITGRLPRLVREICRTSGKKVELHVAGEEVGLDRAILEELADPLVHLVRNAVDHGIEASGTVSVCAWREPDMVLLEVADDGRGMDPFAIRRKALEKGIVTPAQARAMRPQDLLQLVCRPGFSTAAEITETSGRGVGMDVVKTAVENLGGLLDIQSEPGRGTRFLLKLPLSVAIIHILLVECAGQTIGIPLTRVLRTLDVCRDEVRASGRQLVLDIEDEGVPLLSLRKMLQLPARPSRGNLPVVITEGRRRRVGLVVDRLVGQREVFVKSLEFPLNRLPGVSGATVLGDGSVIFIIDPPSLLEVRPGAPAVRATGEDS